MNRVSERPMHCLSFDVEEHFQVSAFWSEARRQQWDHYESRVESNTRKLAEMLAQHGTKATFFVLGWVAERYPSMVKALASQGHEIASHGYGHELVTTQSPESFRHDVRLAKRILEDLTGTSVNGYRVTIPACMIGFTDMEIASAMTDVSKLRRLLEGYGR